MTFLLISVAVWSVLAFVHLVNYPEKCDRDLKFSSFMYTFVIIGVFIASNFLIVYRFLG